MFRITCAILHLGNIDFVPFKPGDTDSRAVVEDSPASQNALKAAAQMLKLEPELLVSRLTLRTMTVGARKSVSTIPLKAVQAADSR